MQRLESNRKYKQMMTENQTNEKEKPKIVRRVSIIETMRALAHGQAVTLRARDGAPLSTARSAASRLNAESGYTEFSVMTDDNGTSYTIHRK